MSIIKFVVWFGIHILSVGNIYCFLWVDYSDFEFFNLLQTGRNADLHHQTVKRNNGKET